MRGRASAEDVEGELRELRRRAYGPHPDIEDDAIALARLIELESARTDGLDEYTSPPIAPVERAGAEPLTAREPTTVVASVVASAADARMTDAGPEASSRETPESPTGDPRPAVKWWWALIALAAGAVVGVAGVAASAMPSYATPDARLNPTGAVPDDALLALLRSEGGSTTPRYSSEMEIDLSTLRGFGTYLEFDVWSADNSVGSQCMTVVHRQSDDVVARKCVPAGVDLFVDVPWRVRHGSGSVRHLSTPGAVLRLVLREDAVDAYLLMPKEAA
ncbi:hypothetical protein [Microbacterium sp. SS28]|uniref:hypothetical protein n=1 Tax=Microbacterium sp. SS28 TaxID=2919948 RepID=UPI001FAACB6F|nr:hypothetical protein [Microbacterium sp. SS28]